MSSSVFSLTLNYASEVYEKKVKFIYSGFGAAINISYTMGETARPFDLTYSMKTLKLAELNANPMTYRPLMRAFYLEDYSGQAELLD